jgi:ABC-2 type transport system permease protein
MPPVLNDPNQYSSAILGALNLVVFGAIVAILLVSHEYRYNTIMYTLTNSNSRSKVLLAKIIVISVYAVFLTILIGILSPVMTHLGIAAHGHTLGPQIVDYGNVIWRSLFYGWAYGMTGLLLAVLIRSQVGAIAALFLLPGLIEQLLTLWLKSNASYLPFTALSNVINSTPSGLPGRLTPSESAGVFLIYLVVGWVVAWILFLRRDAN